MIIRCPSSSTVKINAIIEALGTVRPGEDFDIQKLPVELQDRDDLQIKAQPEGDEEIVGYARTRLEEMCRQYGPAPGLDIGIESGAVEGADVAAVVLGSAVGEIAVALSLGIPFPSGSLDEAHRRGFKTTTAGEIIHEQHPDIPANSWQEYFPPYISRQQQLRDAIVDALLQAPELFVPTK